MKKPKLAAQRSFGNTLNDQLGSHSQNLYDLTRQQPSENSTLVVEKPIGEEGELAY